MLTRLGFPSVGEHRRFVTAIVADTVGSGLFMPITLLYFLAMTDLSLVQIGSALSLSALLTHARRVRHRQPRRPLRPAPDDARRQPRAGGRHGGLPLGRLAARGGAVDDPAQPRPPVVLGLLRQRGHRDLGAGGARAVVRLPPGGAQPRLLRRRRAGRHRAADRHRCRPTSPSWWSTPSPSCSPSCCSSTCPTTGWRVADDAPVEGWGVGPARPGLPPARARPVRLRGRDDGAQLRAAGLRRRDDRPARAGWSARSSRSTPRSSGSARDSSYAG